MSLPADRARQERLAAIRARRGSPEREAAIEELQRRPQPRRAASEAGSSRKTPDNSTDFFGHPWPLWFRMRDAGHAFLKECASRRTTTSYGLVWDEVVRRLGEDLGNPWRQLPHLLGAISEVSFDESGVFATALVVYDGEGQGPGPGFFRLAAQVGLIREDDAPPAGETWTGMNPAQLAFWNSQVEAMFDR